MANLRNNIDSILKKYEKKEIDSDHIRKLNNKIKDSLLELTKKERDSIENASKIILNF